MKKIIFKIKKLKEVKFDMSIENIRKYPTHKQHFFEIEDKFFSVAYDPAKNLNELEYARFIKNQLIEMYSTPDFPAIANQINQL